MKIRAGQQAIPFQMYDIHSQLINLSDFKRQPILLSFFRDTTCLFCNLRIHQMIEKIPEWSESGLIVIAFFTSSKNEIKRFTGRQNPPFIVIPDPDLLMYNEYGLEKSIFGKLKALLRFRKMVQALKAGVFSIRSLPKRNTLPADFLIDQDQMIAHSHYGEDFADHVSFEKIDEWLAHIQ